MDVEEELVRTYGLSEPTPWTRYIVEITNRDRIDALHFYSPNLEKVPFTEENKRYMKRLVEHGWISSEVLWGMNANRLANVAFLLDEGFEVSGEDPAWETIAKVLDETPPERFKEVWNAAKEITPNKREAFFLTKAWVNSKKDLRETARIIRPYFDGDASYVHWMTKHGPKVWAELVRKKLDLVGKEHAFNENLLYHYNWEDVRKALETAARLFPNLPDEEKKKLAVNKGMVLLARANDKVLAQWKEVTNVAYTFELHPQNLRLAFLKALDNEESYIELESYKKEAIEEIFAKAKLLKREGVLEEIAYSGAFFYMPYKKMDDIIKAIKQDHLIKDKKASIVEHIRDGIGPHFVAHPRMIGDLWEEKFREHHAQLQRERKIKEMRR